MRKARPGQFSHWSNMAIISARIVAEAYPVVKEVQEALGKKLPGSCFADFPLTQAHPYALVAQKPPGGGAPGKILEMRPDLRGTSPCSRPTSCPHWRNRRE